MFWEYLIAIAIAIIAFSVVSVLLGCIIKVAGNYIERRKKGDRK